MKPWLKIMCSLERGDVSLRQWLDKPERSVDAFECLHIFRQVVEIVNTAHSQGIAVHNVRPSCFVMSSYSRVSFIESESCSYSGSDTLEVKDTSSSLPYDMRQQRNRLRSEDFHAVRAPTNALSVHSARGRGNVVEEEEKEQPFPMEEISLMETIWYTSPEEGARASSSCASDIYQFGVLLFQLFCSYNSRDEKMYTSPEDGEGASSSSCASDIYRLGVLLFELFCPYISVEEKSRTMSSLRYRLLPPQFLLKWPKAASFCLWLLHPEPTSRPKMGELLQSKFLNEPRDDLQEREAAIEVNEKIEEQESLLEFLLSLQQRKREAADKLQESVSFLCSDIEEVKNQQTLLKEKVGGLHQEVEKDQVSTSNVPLTNVIDSHESSWLMKNCKKLESAYFFTRSSVNNPASKERYIQGRENGWINPFHEDLCKYLSFTKLKVKADLNQGDLLNLSNFTCSLSFDRDGDFFASAGVNKKIKVFEFDAIIGEDRDIHYPVVEMVSGSKLSSLCWNSYIKSQIASSNYEGTVQVWDVTRSQVLTEMKEHEKRVWSIDFSSADPAMLASGGDDGSVKLWSIHQRESIGTINTKANVCSVQFPSNSGRSLAFGSADHKIYYYDLRNSKVPLCTLVGHDKAVSYVKFMDAMNLVSASTDNTLKLWDMSTCASRVIDSPVQSFIGHTNVKNFVGLSVSDGYIATGSETNEVFVYHKAFPMPTLSFKFSNVDRLYGSEVQEPAQFISSVCWRGQSSMLIAASSSGNVKILEMV